MIGNGDENENEDENGKGNGNGNANVVHGPLHYRCCVSTPCSLPDDIGESPDRFRQNSPRERALVFWEDMIAVLLRDTYHGTVPVHRIMLNIPCDFAVHSTE